MYRSIRIVVLVPLCAISLSACASTHGLSGFLQEQPHYRQAKIVSDSPGPSMQVIQVAQPLPLPGQLKPKPEDVAHMKQPPKARVEAANRAALQEPNGESYINAIQVYPYSKGALYRLYAAPEEVSDVALEPGEDLTAISAGDTTRWVVGDTTSGSGTDRTVHILVKPFAANLRTNLVITTNRRSYHLELQSTKDTYMAAISWNYPQDSLVSLDHRGSMRGIETDLSVSPENLHFNYAISGDDPPWRPVRAFDDGTHVYIEFPKAIDKGDAPPLFVIGTDDDSNVVNYRMHGNFYIVDQLFAAAELRFGQKDQKIVRIERTEQNELRTADAITGQKAR